MRRRKEKRKRRRERRKRERRAQKRKRAKDETTRRDETKRYLSISEKRSDHITTKQLISRSRELWAVSTPKRLHRGSKNTT